MKKKYLNMAIVLVMSLALAACGNAKNDSENQSGNQGGQSNPGGSVDYSAQLKKDMEEYKKYVTLGQYKGFEISINKDDYAVTQEDVEEYINNIRSTRGESKDITSGTTKMGDKIRFDYKGTLDGVAFSGGTATDVEYTIGAGRYIADLENGIIGLEVGKQYDIPCHFDDTYYNSDLAGKDVIFTVTVSAIIETVLPEYNDEFVKSLVSTGAYDTTAQTTKEFDQYAEQYLKDTAKQNYENKKYSLIWDKIDETTTVSGYPEEELKSVTETIINNANTEYSYYKTYYTDMDTFEAYLKSVYGFSSEDDFKKYADEYAKEYLAEKMIMTLIGENENVIVSEDEIKEYGEIIAKENNYGSYQDILNGFGEEIKLEVGYSVLADKVSDILLSNAIEK